MRNIENFLRKETTRNKEFREENRDIIEDESMYKWGIKTALKKFGISYKVARRHFRIYVKRL